MPKFNLHIKVDGLWKAEGNINADSDQEAVNIATRLFPDKLLRVTPQEIRFTGRGYTATTNHLDEKGMERPEITEMQKWTTYGPRLLQSATALRDCLQNTSGELDHLDHAALQNLIGVIEEIEGKSTDAFRIESVPGIGYELSNETSILLITEREEWINEIKRVAFEKYGFTQSAIINTDWDQYAASYYDEEYSRRTPEEAMREDLKAGK